MTVEPVVVTPAAASKMASVTLISSEEARSGMAPIRVVCTQSRLTTKKPKRDVIGGAAPWVASTTARARPPVKKAEKAKTCQSSLP